MNERLCQQQSRQGQCQGIRGLLSTWLFVAIAWLAVVVLVGVFSIVPMPLDAHATTPDESAARVDTTVTYDTSLATQTTLERLVSVQTSLDGELVRFHGEAVGDIIKAKPGYKWILMEDDGSALSVLMTDEQAALIDTLGRYGTRGSILEVIGVYHVADPDEAGELDVRAVSVALVSEGERVDDQVHPAKLIAGVVLLVAAGGLTLLYRSLKRRAV